MTSWLAHLRMKFRGLDARYVQQLQMLFSDFESHMNANKPKNMGADGYSIKVDRALNYVLHNLEIDPACDLKQPKIYYRLEARELDFALGENVYSTTPRLLLRVPAAREPGASGPIEVKPTTTVMDANVKREPVTEETVLIIHNQEGEQENLNERPVVQVSSMSPGKYVIYGRIPMADRKKVYDIVADVMNPPEGVSAFKYLDEAGTVEKLAEIIRRMQQIGFANMYGTHEGYRTTNVQPLPAYEGRGVEPTLSGFYEKPANAVLNSAVFLPGPIAFIGKGRAQETLPESGYAVLEQVVGADHYEIRPHSPAFISENYVYRMNRMNVDKEPPQKNMAQVMFVPDHPLRDFVREFETFQYGMAEFNRGPRLQSRPKPGFNRKSG